jgi:hypothetical protein
MKTLLTIIGIACLASVAQAATVAKTQEEYMTKMKANYEAKGLKWDEKKQADKFAKMDANHDGILTAKEHKDWIDSRKKK